MRFLVSLATIAALVSIYTAMLAVLAYVLSWIVRL